LRCDAVPVVQLPTPEQQFVREVHGLPAPDGKHIAGVHALVSYVQSAVHDSVPPPKPRPVQV